jgi:hypothetical protein
VRAELSACTPADRARRVTDPVVFAVVAQLLIHAAWKFFALRDADMSVVLELVWAGVALHRLVAIGRLATLYRVTATAAVSGRIWPARAQAQARG